MIRTRRIASATATALALGAGGAGAVAQPGPAAQPAEVRVQLAADPERRGPAALTWLRGRFLRALPAWPPGRDPFGEFSLRLSPGGVEVESQTSGALDNSYLQATIQVPGVGTLQSHRRSNSGSTASVASGSATCSRMWPGTWTIFVSFTRCIPTSPSMPARC